MMKRVKLKLKRIDLGEEGCHLFCKGRIRDKNVRILIDTGASKSVISEELSTRIEGLSPVEVAENETSGIGPEKVVTQFAKLPRLRLGELKIKNLVVGVMDLGHVKSLYLRMGFKPFDMILGGEILDKHEAIIDYKKKTLLLKIEPTPKSPN